LSLVATCLASIAAFLSYRLALFKQLRANRCANRIPHRSEVAVTERLSSLLATRLASLGACLRYRLPRANRRLLGTHTIRANHCKNQQRK
jgi:hypothetical protein